MLRASPGARVLDVGCGTGADVRAIAARVGPAGRVVGLDSSKELTDRIQRSEGVLRGIGMEERERRFLFPGIPELKDMTAWPTQQAPAEMRYLAPADPSGSTAWTRSAGEVIIPE